MSRRVVDVHVHIQPLETMADDCAGQMMPPAELARFNELSRSPEAFLRFMDQEGIEKVCLIVCVAEAVMGYSKDVNAWSAGFARGHRDRLLPFGSVDPTTTRDARTEMLRILDDYGMAGLKLHPPHQLFRANQYREGLEPLATIYGMAEEAGLPVMIHTGSSIFPRARNVYADPIFTDDVAVDFPRLKLILAHGGRPLWMPTAAFLARRHPNVHLDLSGIPPQKLLEAFPRFEELAPKFLWGSDWAGPGVPGMAANVRRFLELPISEATRQRVLFDNAASLFGLEGTGKPPGQF
jgi:hypothetical protein